MVHFESESSELKFAQIKFNNYNRHVQFQIQMSMFEEIIPVFIKAVVFHHVGP